MPARNSFVIVLAILSLCGCVDLPVQDGQREKARAVSLETYKLDPGAKNTETLHFLVKAYSSARTEEVAAVAERNYEQIMHETGLFSFMPQSPYEIVCYANAQEYHSKTDQPEWSGGATIGNAIIVYDSPQMESVLAHEMTHLVFNEYMGRFESSQRWINEGLAMYMESKTYSGDRAQKFQEAVKDALATNIMPLQRMAEFLPASQTGSIVNNWYYQAYSMVDFMINKGGRIGFGVFLSELKQRTSQDEALRRAYPGRWDGFTQFESEWKRGISY